VIRIDMDEFWSVWQNMLDYYYDNELSEESRQRIPRAKLDIDGLKAKRNTDSTNQTS